MTRILSAAALLPIVIGTVWFLPPIATLALAGLAAGLAFAEFRTLAARLGARVPPILGGVAVIAVCIALGLGRGAVDVLLAALLTIGASAVGASQPDPAVLRNVATTLFAPVYIGLPLGALAAVRAEHGREALLALIVTVVVSDAAQYYAGRLFGRRPLSPMVSPAKTVEGAIAGLAAATACLAVVGRFWLAPLGLPVLALVGATLAALGMVGDLFESLLKRSADVKDSSRLIPGHGGILDRLDSWLFAAPAYYLFLRYSL